MEDIPATTTTTTTTTTTPTSAPITLNTTGTSHITERTRDSPTIKEKKRFPTYAYDDNDITTTTTTTKKSKTSTKTRESNKNKRYKTNGSADNRDVRGNEGDKQTDWKKVVSVNLSLQSKLFVVTIVLLEIMFLAYLVVLSPGISKALLWTTLSFFMGWVLCLIMLGLVEVWYMKKKHSQMLLLFGHNIACPWEIFVWLMVNSKRWCLHAFSLCRSSCLLMRTQVLSFSYFRLY
jgi:hypothetical protein